MPLTKWLGGKPSENAARQLPADVFASLDSTIALAHREQVPTPFMARLRRIVALVHDALPHIVDLPADSMATQTVRAIAEGYLPDVTFRYVRLPRTWADHAMLDCGRTSLERSLASLDEVTGIMWRLRTAAVQGDAKAFTLFDDNDHVIDLVGMEREAHTGSPASAPTHEVPKRVEQGATDKPRVGAHAALADTTTSRIGA